MFNLFLILHSFLSFSSSTISANTDTNKNKTYYIANCTVLDSDFKVVRTMLNGNICLPLEDGSIIATDSTSYIKKLSPDGEVLWQKKGYYHHQVVMSPSSNILAMRLVEIKKVLYDEICEIDSQTGKDLRVFSIYKAIQNNRYKFKNFDRLPFAANAYLGTFTTNLEKLHVNSISSYKNEFFINEIDWASFVLDSDFKFSRFVDLSVIAFPGSTPAVHDLQKTSENRYIIFKNFNEDPKLRKKTFKIFEFDEKKIHFEFPLKKNDFVEGDYSGGVQKIDDTYLTGFPVSGDADSNSFVALISNKGFYIKKAILPFRIQDIKLIAHDDFLFKNKMK